MRNFLFLTVAALAAPGLVLAQTAPPRIILNEQLQLDAATMVLTVTVPDAPSVVASSVANGNTTSALTDMGGQTFTNTQRTEGQVAARGEVVAGVIDGLVLNSVNAYGNAAQASALAGDMSNLSSQDMANRTEATAFTGVTTGGTDIVTSATAVANAYGFANRDAEINGNIAQRNDGAVFSSNQLSSCCNTNSMTITSAAVGNSINGVGSSTTTRYNAQQERLGFGSVEAGNLVYSPNGLNVTSASQASGNTHTMTNTFGFVDLGNFQNNQGYVRSQSAVQLDQFSGFATSSAYSVGNSMLLSNSASDTVLGNLQIAEGGVDALASLTGASATGAPVTLSASAIGNAVTGFLCGNCGDPRATPNLTATSNQVNFGAVRSFGTVTMTGPSGAVIASGAAIGNTASFISNRGN